MLVSLIIFLIVGLIAGFLARALVPGRDPMGVLGTILLGCAGAVVGGYAWRALFGDSKGVEWIGAVIGAVVLLLIYKAVTGRSRSGAY